MKRKQIPNNDADSGPTMMEIDSVAGGTPPRAVKRRRKDYIPKVLKIAVWTHYIGIEKGTSICKVCDTNTISQLDFHCGHIQAEAEGGPTCLTNLMPICGKCNTSMGKRNLCEFKNAYFK